MRILLADIKKDRKIKIMVFIFLGGLFLINLLLNYQYLAGDRVLYLDELDGYINNYHNTSKSIWEKVMGNEVLRPIPRLLLVIIYQLIGKNFTIFSWILLGNNFLLSVIVFCAVYYIQVENNDSVTKLLLSGIGGVMYLLSRFMQCQIFSVLGIMEGLSLGSVLLMSMMLIAYIRTDKIKYFSFSCIFWVISLYCHERYFGLLAILVLVCLYKWKQRKLPIMAPLFIGVLYWLQRTLTLTDSLRGTGKVSITDSFSIAKFFKLVFSQIAYIMGINAGPEARNGVNFREVPAGINLFIGGYIICILAIFILFVYMVVTKKDYQKNELLVESVLLIFTIGCCIAQSSVTTDVAVRFVYVSYSLFLILILRMISYLLEKYGKAALVWGIAVCMVCSAVVFEVYYRSQIVNVGFYKYKVFSESLYDITIKRYGKEFAESDVVVVNNHWNWSEENWKEFFEPYIETDDMNVVFYQSMQELMASGMNTEGWMIIIEDEKSYMCYEISKEALYGQ